MAFQFQPKKSYLLAGGLKTCKPKHSFKKKKKKRYYPPPPVCFGSFELEPLS